MPTQAPIGLLLARTAKTASRAFDAALQQGGGSLPTWLVLMALMRGGHRTQAELAATVGIQGPTLTHHLNGMERDGLLTRTRLPENRRVHAVAPTEQGRALFHRLRQCAVAHDARLRAGIPPEHLEIFRAVLDRMAANVAAASSEETRHD
ncbi:MarR family winged helix-turn-helix transcriptional regulator [Luteimonas aquatica]|uniref:MarR family winged helix-turn-helix transcriptional regulator n=1 Tax=Luteimonas aquatica TaxID=450364 RepID=UPI001F58506E|nr:MarR family winged helix-turn-helix transcriptional regulator [Luteimonas aquatica]